MPTLIKSCQIWSKLIRKIGHSALPLRAAPRNLPETPYQNICIDLYNVLIGGLGAPRSASEGPLEPLLIYDCRQI
jgi:hypothetical protein